MEQAKAKGTRQVLHTRQDFRAAVAEITGLADRALAIMTPDLEPEIYDHDDFLEPLKRFILARSFARVRVLIVDPARALKNGNRFVTMGRRLNSYIEFRNAKPQYRDHPEAFCIADETALVYRPLAEQWQGMADSDAPLVARKYLETFESLWNACELEPQLRRLQS